MTDADGGNGDGGSVSGDRDGTAGDTTGDRGDDSDPVLVLPDALRPELRDPMGPLHEDATALLAAVDGPVVAVGDVVAATLLRTERPPAVAFVDGRTERRPVDDGVAGTLAAVSPAAVVRNDAGTLSASLLRAVAEYVGSLGTGPRNAGGAPALIEVAGEEDLAVLPVIAAAPEGATVVYGQPGEGMVEVTVTPEARKEALALLDRFEGDHGLFRDLLAGAIPDGN